MMNNKFMLFLCTSFLCFSFILISCGTEPEPVIEEEDVIIDNVEPENPDVQEEFVVTDELYQNTFSEIEKLIENLNQIISRKQFDTWKTYLSQSYIDLNSDPENLRTMSQSPILINNDIVLKDLEDLFNFIVVPSRSRTVVNEIEFETEKKIVVWSSFNGRRVKLYQLEKIDDNWKISTW